MTATLLILFLALILDRLVGDPDKLWRRVPHPVVLFGRAIGLIDKLFNGSPAWNRLLTLRTGMCSFCWPAAAADGNCHEVGG